jgi:DNA-binding NarL/FixJ family response regulator
MKRVRLVVVDDHTLFRSGLIGLLNDAPELEVVGEAADGATALEVIAQTQPDVVLLDVNMPQMSGLETMEKLRHNGETCHVLMLTISKSEDDLIGAIRAGADGYLLKSAEVNELKKAILLLQQGLSVLSPQVTRQVLRAVKAQTSPKNTSALSEREIEILKCLARGFTTLTIAESLVISENTVKTLVRHILEKLEASNRAEAVSRATALGILKE